VELTRKGCANLNRHIENTVCARVSTACVFVCTCAVSQSCAARLFALLSSFPPPAPLMQLKFGLKPIVVVNRMTTDTAAEIAVIREEALAHGAADCVASNHWWVQGCTVPCAVPMCVELLGLGHGRQGRGGGGG
jgi:formyltetrahydrofolate synthetase